MRINVIGIAAAALSIVACSGGSPSGGNASNFTTVKVEKTVNISQEQGSPQCRVSLMLAAAKEGEQAKAINEAIANRLLNFEGVADLQVAADSFANTYTKDYQANIAPLYREDRNDPEKRPWYEYHYNITSEANTGRKGITVYTANVEYYEGGAHGIHQKLIMNFDEKTGQLLTLSDVFVPGFETTLNGLLLQKLIEQTGAKDQEDLRARGYLYSMDMFAPENFSLNDGDVTFVYNPYEIASYDKGMTELTIDNDELEGIWK